MPASVDDLVSLLALERIEDNLFRGTQPDTIMQRVFGGQVAAQALVAATITVDPAYVVHSLHSYFLRPGDPRVPIVYDVDDLRDGRSFATRRVVARQHGRPIYFQTLNYQKPERGLEHQDVMPAVPAPEDCPTMGEVWRRRRAAVTGEDAEELRQRNEAAEKEWAALAIRWAGDSSPAGDLDPGERPAQSRLWIRATGALPDDPTLHQAVFTYASDMTLLGASLTPHGREGVQMASLDHTIWFHRPFRTDEWWLYDQWSPSASGGRGLAIGRIFTADGTLVATVAQEGLIRISHQEA